MKQRNGLIDILKGISIIFVIITHFNVDEFYRNILGFPLYIYKAVPCFMILSGYTYSLKYLDKERLTVMGVYQYANIKKSIMRYVLPYGMVFPIMMILSDVGNDIDIKNILYAFVRGGESTYGYYIPVMIQIVLIFPIIVYCVRKYEFKAIIACAIINLGYEVSYGFGYYISREFYVFTFFRYIFLIAIGCYFAFMFEFENKRVWNFLFIVGFLTIISQNYILPFGASNSFFSSPLLAALYIAPIIRVLLIKFSSIKSELLELVGRASYHIFLVQTLYYYYGICNYIFLYVTNKMVQFVISLLFCILGGVFFYYIEKILYKLINIFRIRKFKGDV